MTRNQASSYHCPLLNGFPRTPTLHLMTAPFPAPQFLFAVCQHGAEGVCKQEIVQHHPELRLAYSRPGLLTFKLALDDKLAPEEAQPAATNWGDHPTLVSTFARTFGVVLQKFANANLQEQLTAIAELVRSLPMEQLHVWQRDEALPGDRGFEPFPTVLAEEVGQQLLAVLNTDRSTPLELNRVAGVGQRVLDVILVQPNEWLVGWHTADSIPQRWPGGVPPLDPPEEMVSRAWLKLAEALEWGRIKMGPEDVCVEIGSSPGGAAQLLLDRGATVIAVDPADLDETIAEHPNLTHLKKRGKHVRKAELAEARWLLVDVNVAPNYTLDTAEEIVTSAKTNIRGLILTMKLTDWSLAEHIEGYRQRVRNWGFKVIRTRQLAFNRHEFCLLALRNRYDARATSGRGDARTPNQRGNSPRKSS
ncbi:MAG: SAM-dependent methyltransferase [Planctomycetota bacterium]|jgi:23S rRNA (cytidine2498-2'-O)-methyltransferase